MTDTNKEPKKYCRGCKRRLPLSAFETCMAKEDGYMTRCIECNEKGKLAQDKHYEKYKGCHKRIIDLDNFISNY